MNLKNNEHNNILTGSDIDEEFYKSEYSYTKSESNKWGCLVKIALPSLIIQLILSTVALYIYLSKQCYYSSYFRRFFINFQCSSDMYSSLASSISFIIFCYSLILSIIIIIFGLVKIGEYESLSFLKLHLFASILAVIGLPLSIWAIIQIFNLLN